MDKTDQPRETHEGCTCEDDCRLRCIACDKVYCCCVISVCENCDNLFCDTCRSAKPQVRELFECASCSFIFCPRCLVTCGKCQKTFCNKRCKGIVHDECEHKENKENNKTFEIDDAAKNTYLSLLPDDIKKKLQSVMKTYPFGNQTVPAS